MRTEFTDRYGQQLSPNPAEPDRPTALLLDSLRAARSGGRLAASRWAARKLEALMSVTRINEFQAKAEQGNSLREFLISIMPMIQSSDGCESCQLLQSQDDPTRFVIIEVWGSVEAHKASLRNIPPEKFSQVKPLLAAPPSGSYYGAQP